MALTLDTKQLNEVWDAAEDTRTKQDKRQDYYAGKHDIMGNTGTYASGDTRTNRVTNWIEYIINGYVGALTSIPYQIVKASDESENEGPALYNQISDSQQLIPQDVDNLRKALIHGFSIETHEFVDSAIVIRNHDPRCWVPIFDSKANLVGAVYRITLAAGSILDGKYLTEDTEFMSYYNDWQIFDYRYSKTAKAWEPLREPTSHKYGQVPIVVWKHNKDMESFLGDALLGQNDEYNEIDSMSGDDIRNEIDSLLVITGHDPDWIMKQKDLINDYRILPLEGKDRDQGEARAYYLQRSFEYGRVDSRLKRCRDQIHVMAAIPDVETIVGATHTTSGIALKLKFLPMIQRASSMVNYLKQGIMERIDLINAMTGKTGRGKIEDVNAVVQFSLPVNRIEEWRNVGSLAGVVSHRTQLELLSDIGNPEEELTQLESERAQDTLNQTPEGVAATQEAIVNKAAETLQPVVEQAVQTISDAALDQLLRNGGVDRIVKARKEANANNI